MLIAIWFHPMAIVTLMTHLTSENLRTLRLNPLHYLRRCFMCFHFLGTLIHTLRNLPQIPPRLS
jgi:hypothetical protein